MKKIILILIITTLSTVLKAQDSENLKTKWKKSISLNGIEFDGLDFLNFNGEFSRNKYLSFFVGVNYGNYVPKGSNNSNQVLYNEKAIQELSSFMGIRVYPNGQENRFSFFIQSDFIYQNFSKGIINDDYINIHFRKRKDLLKHVEKYGNAHFFDYFLGIGFKFKISETFFLEHATKYHFKQIINKETWNYYDGNLANQFGFGVTF